MKVKELIQELKGLDPEAVVFVVADHDWNFVHELMKIEIADKNKEYIFEDDEVCDGDVFLDCWG